MLSVCPPPPSNPAGNEVEWRHLDEQSVYSINTQLRNPQCFGNVGWFFGFEICMGFGFLGVFTLSGQGLYTLEDWGLMMMMILILLPPYILLHLLLLLSPVTCHLSPALLCTIVWFTKTKIKTRKKNQNKKSLQTKWVLSLAILATRSLSKSLQLKSWNYWMLFNHEEEQKEMNKYYISIISY